MQRFRKVSLREGLILCFLMLPLGGAVLLILEIVCGTIGCPKDNVSIPMIVAIIVVISQQFRLLELWQTRRRELLGAALAAYVFVGYVLWGVLTGRIRGW